MGPTGIAKTAHNHGRRPSRHSICRIDWAHEKTRVSTIRLVDVGEPLPSAGFLNRERRYTLARSRSTNAHWMRAALMAVDLALVSLSGLLSYKIRFSSDLSSLFGMLEHPLRNSSVAASTYVGFLLLYSAVIALIIRSRVELPRCGNSGTADCFLVAQAVGIATVLVTAAIYLSGSKVMSRLVVGLCATLSALTLCSWRVCCASWIRRRRSRGIGLRHALIVGAGKVGELLAKQFQLNPALGYSVRGFLDSNHHQDSRVLGKIEDLAEVTSREFIDEVFITIPSEREVVKDVARKARKLGLTIKVVPEFYDGLAWLSPIEFIGDFPVSVLHSQPVRSFQLFLKRFTDVAGASLALALLSPVLGIIALAIKLDSPGPVIHRARRIGRKGRGFTCFKFRTMVANAREMKADLQHLNERQGPFFKLKADPRVTKLGGFLRKYSLDELPQLWNVLKGEMSLVGPRPPEEDETSEYEIDQLRRLDAIPGITGLWQISARDDPSFEKAVTLDIRYIQNWNYFLDIQILIKTIPAVLKANGR